MLLLPCVPSLLKLKLFCELLLLRNDYGQDGTGLTMTMMLSSIADLWAVTAAAETRRAAAHLIRAASEKTSVRRLTVRLLDRACRIRRWGNRTPEKKTKPRLI